ncbi:VanZ family protein [Xanthomonas sp. NCPPB 2654]|uniref:VanZ family protein n=1 Tax=unclassified Xanthomonas TaxID=2643310 RepID=UPI0021E0EAA3|nr:MULTISPECIES: VanZ family protein [unclassified Xanthomonas]MDL5367165.1 VanZ family protein [Xanthomonas sp. NCPPB 2654]UYC19987.1 VanZ family protein [Xanthomonas sp. CFBP 8443]
MAAVSARALRDFRRPAPWLGLWLLAIAAVIAVCLGPPPQIPELPSGSDKIEHFLAYFLLAWGAVQLFARPRALLLAALGLVALGIGIEFAQGALTTDRLADPRDALANSVGVAAGMALLPTPLRNCMLWLDRCLFGRRAPA